MGKNEGGIVVLSRERGRGIVNGALRLGIITTSTPTFVDFDDYRYGCTLHIALQHTRLGKDGWGAHQSQNSWGRHALYTTICTTRGMGRLLITCYSAWRWRAAREGEDTHTGALTWIFGYTAS